MGHGEDYFWHTNEKYMLYDFFDNNKLDFSASGTYSTVCIPTSFIQMFKEAYRTIIVQTLFTEKAREIIQDHSNKEAEDHPLFLYVAYQNIHGPPEVPHSHIRVNDPHGQRKIVSGWNNFRSA